MGDTSSGESDFEVDEFECAPEESNSTSTIQIRINDSTYDSSLITESSVTPIQDNFFRDFTSEPELEPHGSLESVSDLSDYSSLFQDSDVDDLYPWNHPSCESGV